VRHLSIIFLFVLLITACSPTAEQIEAAIDKTNEAKPTNTETSFPTPTSTFTLTFTPTNTNTPKPTNTKRPTNTPTPKPEPIIFEGSGDDVIQFDKWDGPAIVDAVREGGGHFAITSYDKDGEYLELLVNTIGPYQGKVSMDLLGFGDTNATMLEISASGPWQISIYPFDRDYQNQVSVPGSYENNTDDLVVVDGSPSTATFICSDGHFAVWGISEDDIDLLVNDIAPYEGKVIVSSSVFLIVVSAGSSWSVVFD